MSNNEYIKKAEEELEYLSGDEETRRLAFLRDKAIRDEGSSYHYLPPSRFVETNNESINFIGLLLHIGNLKIIVPINIIKTIILINILHKTLFSNFIISFCECIVNIY